MLYSERLPLTSQTAVNVRLTDFSNGINTQKSHSVLPLNYAVNSYNFDLSSGALKEGLGLKVFTTPYTRFGNTYTKTYDAPEGVTKIQNFWFYRRYDYDGEASSPMMLIYGDDNKLYGTTIRSTLGFSEIGSVSFDGDPVGINYRLDNKDCMIFCSTSAQDYLYTWDSINTVQKYIGCPAVLSLAKHAGRLFATSTGDKKKLYFSDDLDPRNWQASSTEGGYIEISDERGTLNKLIEWNNYLYIIRDYGITRLSAWGEQEDFVVRHLYLSTGRIYANSAVHCGSCILMLCKDGLYLFDGVDTKKINTGLDKFFEGVDNESAVGAFLDGKYYLSCHLNFGDNKTVGCETGTYTNNALVEYDISTGKLNILRGVDIRLMQNVQTPDFSKLVCCVNTTDQQNILMEVAHDGKVLDVPTTKFWGSPTTDLGYPDKKKVLNEIYITSSADAKLVITTDNCERLIDIYASIVPKKYKINLKCSTFSLAFLSDAQSIDILPPTLKATIV